MDDTNSKEIEELKESLAELKRDYWLGNWFVGGGFLLSTILHFVALFRIGYTRDFVEHWVASVGDTLNLILESN